MRLRGLEPPRDKLPLGPQPSASADSATTAYQDNDIYYIRFIFLCQYDCLDFSIFFVFISTYIKYLL